MKIFICASKHCYQHVAPIKEALEAAGHEITLPNSYERPMAEEEMKASGAENHAKWKGEKLLESIKKSAENDAIVVLNFEKHGQPNYIGGATFLEIFKGFELGKKIYFYNPIPDGILRDELLGMQPVILNGNLNLIT